MSDIQHFETYSLVSANIHIHISLARFSEQFRKAQLWLGYRVLEDCIPFMPMKTGSLIQRSHIEDDGKQVVFPGPYGRFQYGGLVMVDPETGSPWARKGAKKVLTNRPLRYSNPNATPEWFNTAKERNGEYWLNEVKRIGGGR